ncbi:trans-sulfuration enzyme family protein [Paenibacillus mendelii]|uniref:Trans-sulfuration enzyme family protein n=1 Tax=Paenibacillus mendelii TaxID=206163 RepID=A0ABV6J5U4_9BACL|nr:PLP-dependent aspartate aminotransferase family protein [Paenibacillus mendelii]MCQ6560043.1 PLP-dependent aspartate aminotransferase family protein [Paenibacillus mendelii]
MAQEEKEGSSVYTTVSYDPTDTRHHGAISVPVYQSSLFAFERYDQFDAAFSDLFSHHVYSRGNNPTVEYLERKLAELEEGEAARCFASGMAAITSSIMSLVRSGDHIICVNQVYGPTKEFLGSYLSRFGIETTFVDGRDMVAWQAAIQPNTKLFYLESPTTMMFELQDLRACTSMAKSIGAATIIDNTWATSCYQKPLSMGVDLVVHSLTKYVSGHSDCVGGAVIGSKRLIDQLSHHEYMLFGGIMAPQIAALLTRGLRTLPLRMQRHESSGLIVAAHMEKQSYVRKVNHPGLASHPQHDLACEQMTGYSSLFSFEADQPVELLKEWANRLQYFKIGVSWGGFESLVTVNSIGGTQSHSSIVRIYVGQENPEDLIRDIDQAWQQIGQGSTQNSPL